VSGHERDHLQERLRELRETFDRAFAREARQVGGERNDFLAIRVGGDPYALRLSELLGVAAGKKIVTTPSHAPAMLGLAGFRGAVTPVFDLGRLLGYADSEAPRWIALARERQQIGFAFEVFEAHVRAGVSDLIAEASSERAGLRGALRDAELTRPIIHFPTLLSIIQRRAPEAGASEER
jgi:chemotaxis signal transduction protein